MSNISFNGGSGGGTNNSGWLQTTGAPGNTTTTPINAPGGSGQAGPNIYMFAGNGDGTGNAGNIVLEMAVGVQSFDPVFYGPVTAVVLLDGTSQNGNFYFAQPFETVGNGQNVFLYAGGTSDAAGTGGAINFFSGQGFVGGQVQFQAGTGLGGGGGAFAFLAGSDVVSGDGGSFAAAAGDGVNGGDFSMAGGVSSLGGGRGGDITLASGQGRGSGGGQVIIRSGPDTTTGQIAGDITFQYGLGDVRNGVLFLNLNTTDPGVLGAAFMDSNSFVVMESGGTSFTGTITTAALTTLGTQGSMTFSNGILISQVAAT